ncbi:MAG: glycosyltransferase family 9 protein [Desulfovibrio sp.]
MSAGTILVLQMQRMGDLVLTFPLLLWLSRRHPEYRLHVVAEKSFSDPLLRVSPHAAYISSQDALSGALDAQHFRMVINLSVRQEAARLAGRLASDEVVGPVLGTDGCLRVRGAWQLYRTSLVQNNRHNRFHWADLNALDLVPLAVTKKTRYSPPRDPQGKETKSVGVFVGASEPGKRPDAAFFAALLRELLDRGLRPVLLGGPNDVPVAQEIRGLFAHPALDLVGKLSLAELVAVGQTLGLFITPDTGPMHVAAWTGIHTLNLSVGNVNPWETGPYQPGHHVLRANISCARGCWTCTRHSALCRQALTPSRVAALAAIALRGPRERMERLNMPGLNLFGTERTEEGLYWMRRLDALKTNHAPNADELGGLFWRAFFLWRLAGTEETPVRDAWRGLCEAQPLLGESLRGSLPGLGKRIARIGLEGLRPQILLEQTPPFWRPLAGYLEAVLENEDASAQSIAQCLEQVEALADILSSR